MWVGTIALNWGEVKINDTRCFKGGHEFWINMGNTISARELEKNREMT
jgi:hypothetical protein